MKKDLISHFQSHFKKLFECSDCGDDFSSSSDLEAHALRHSKEKKFLDEESPQEIISDLLLKKNILESEENVNDDKCEETVTVKWPCDDNLPSSSDSITLPVTDTQEKSYQDAESQLENKPDFFLKKNILESEENIQGNGYEEMCTVNFPCDDNFSNASDSKAHSVIFFQEKHFQEEESQQEIMPHFFLETNIVEEEKFICFDKY